MIKMSMIELARERAEEKNFLPFFVNQKFPQNRVHTTDQRTFLQKKEAYS